MTAYTMLLAPACRTAPWGGRRLADEFGIECDSITNETKDDAAETIPPDADLIEPDTPDTKAAESNQPGIAEAWALSCHPDGRCRVKNGGYEGKTLAEVLSQHRDWMGAHAANFSRFPVMVKLIDCERGTSVHVHPDDEYAENLPDGQGKIDMWYIIDAAPDSEIIYGFCGELTQEELRQRIESGALHEALSYIPVKAGDIFTLEPGTVHAIGEGVLLCEIQQSANTVFRLDDFGRERELCIPEALDVAITLPPTLPPGPPAPPQLLESATITPIGVCDYFSASLMSVDGRTHIAVGEESFVSAVIVGGGGKIFTDLETLEASKGDSLFFPAGTGRVTFSGRLDAVITTI